MLFFKLLLWSLLLLLFVVQQISVVNGGFILVVRRPPTARTSAATTRITADGVATTTTTTTWRWRTTSAPPALYEDLGKGRNLHAASRRRRYNLCCLFAAARGTSVGRANNINKGRKKPKQRQGVTTKGPTGKKNNKNKNKKNINTSNKVSSSSLTQTPEHIDSFNESNNNKKKKLSSSSSAPPWQVLSAKDAKKNVQKEIQRRELVRQRQQSQGQEDSSSSIQQQQQQVLGVQDDDEEDRNFVYSKAFLSDIEQRLLNWKRFNPTTAPAGIKFVGSYLGSHAKVPRLGVPEIAFLGRSNVGKSSLLNRLASSSSSSSSDAGARVGKTPGATASVNLYALQDKKGKDLIGFVDLPGFGYAKLSKDVKEQVQVAAENYLNNRNNNKSSTTKELALGILLVDIRRIPSDDDKGVLAALYDMGVPLMVVATKIDKISSLSQRQNQLEIIRERLGLPDGQPLAISSTTGDGCRQLWRIILEACETTVSEFKMKYEKDDDDYYEDDTDSTTAVDGGEEDDGQEEDDDDDLVYDQGYDWIHAADDDNNIMYDYDDDEQQGDYYDNGGDPAGTSNDYREDDEDSSLPHTEYRRETLQSLKKKARNLERRGEL